SCRWILHYPGVLATAALGAVDDQLARPLRKAGETAGHRRPSLDAADDEGTQVDAARLQLPVADRRVGGEPDRLLGDELLGVAVHRLARPPALRLARPRHDRDAVSAEAAARLDHQLPQALHRRCPGGLVAEVVARHRADRG